VKRPKANAKPSPRPRILAVSLGCPSGIGPEVAVAAAARDRALRCVLVGDVGVIERAAKLRGVARSRLVAVDGKRSAHALEPGQIGVWVASTPVHTMPEPGRPDRSAGAVQLAWIDEATDLVLAGVASALVTGPVSKLAIATSGAEGAAHFRGHTEHLAQRLGAAEVVMAFASAKLTTALVTTHFPLAKVARAITPEAVARATYWLTRLARDLRRDEPTIAIAALNPHAGEGGLLGREEARAITPGVDLARARLAAEGRAGTLVGPIGAETAFRLHVMGQYDGVVAMYHDQATIPMKLTEFGEAVNVTLGLPIVRTSVDHGTGYDLAWTGRAHWRGMRAALRLADLLARARGRSTDDGAPLGVDGRAYDID
jgi:4-hydroxythreonine-4-phosphate dehydrogenase